MKGVIRAGVCAGVLAGAGALLWFAGMPQSQSVVSLVSESQSRAEHERLQVEGVALQAAADAVNVNENAVAGVLAETPRRLDAPFSPSLEGTEIDGSLRADANGQLIVDLQVKDFFDYFLSAVGDVTPEVAVSEIEKLARSSLPPEALAQAMTLLGQYLTYKEAALEMAGQELLPLDQQTPAYQLATLEKALAGLKATRREHLSPEAVDAFFALEESYGEYTLESIRLQQRTDISDAQKAAQMEMARARLPDIVRHTEERMLQEQAHQMAVQKVVTDARSPSEAESGLRQLNVPEEQVTAIVGHLKAQQDFDRQYREYAVAQKQLRASGLSPEDMTRQQEQLQQRYFRDESSITQARLRDLDQSSAL